MGLSTLFIILAMARPSVCVGAIVRVVPAVRVPVSLAGQGRIIRLSLSPLTKFPLPFPSLLAPVSAVLRPAGPAPQVMAPAPGWSLGSYPSAVDRAPVSYKRRKGAGNGLARVFTGGLALNESFETYFAAAGEPAASQLFIWTRAHPPTPWTALRSPLDADARDLARAVLLAARDSSRVELVVHSYGALVFQRMVQLRGDAEVNAALRLLEGSRVVMLNGTTHFEGSEQRAGKDFERMANASRMFMYWLNAMDSNARAWEKAAEINPLMAPSVRLWLAAWRLNRMNMLSLASRDAVKMMRADLEEPWESASDHIRRGFIAALEKDSADPGWQEALLRRTNDMFRLEFSAEDAKALRVSGIRLTLIHSARDSLVNWPSAKALFDLLGIESPAEAPAPGSFFRDPSGLFRAEIVDADHYYPLKNPNLLAEVLNR